MPFRFHKHYTVDEARALLPQIRQWLTRLQEIRKRLDSLDTRVSDILERGDAGGSQVNEMMRLIVELNDVVGEFHAREIQVKDTERGLIDFPSIINGREVFLCWEQDEDDIEYWHELDSGFAGREPL